MKYNGQDGVDKWLHENGYLDTPGVYVDAGASHPIINSNTRLLDSMGWKGICIDADARVQGLYAELRPEPAFELQVLTDKEQVVSFYLNQHQEASGLTDSLGNGTCVQAQGVTLNSILKRHKVKKIDLLSIDCEGHELDVLMGLDMKKHAPRIVIVEHSTFGKTDNRAFNYLVGIGYELLLTTEFNHVLCSK